MTRCWSKSSRIRKQCTAREKIGVLYADISETTHIRETTRLANHSMASKYIWNRDNPHNIFVSLPHHDWIAGCEPKISLYSINQGPAYRKYLPPRGSKCAGENKKCVPISENEHEKRLSVLHTSAPIIRIIYSCKRSSLSHGSLWGYIVIIVLRIMLINRCPIV